jgi:hypothetical protein
MSKYAYTCRRHLFSAATTYVVRDDVLLVQPEKGSDTSIPLSEIRSVQLRDEGPCNNVRVFACVVRTDSRKLVIASASFVRVGELASHPAEYRAFIGALLQALRPHADSVQFIQGSRFYRTMAFIVLTIGSVVLLGVGLAALLTTDHSVPLLFLSKAALFAAVAPGLIGILRRGRQRPFNPADVPAEYLP